VISLTFWLHNEWFSETIHLCAFGGDEETHIGHRVVLDARAKHAANGACLPRRNEGEILSEQPRVDRRIAEPLKPDRPDANRRLDRAAERDRPDVAFLEIVDGPPPRAQILFRAALAVTVERAADIAGGRAASPEGPSAVSVSHFRADEPAAIARGRGLKTARHRVVGNPARAVVIDAAP